MKKLIFTILLITFITGCTVSDDLPLVESTSIELDFSTLKLEEIYLIEDDRTIDSFEYEDEVLITELASHFLDFASQNNANFYGRNFPNINHATLTFSNSDYDYIYIIISQSTEDSELKIGVDILDLEGFKEIHYVDGIANDVLDLLEDLYNNE